MAKRHTEEVQSLLTKHREKEAQLSRILSERSTGLHGEAEGDSDNTKTDEHHTTNTTTRASTPNAPTMPTETTTSITTTVNMVAAEPQASPSSSTESMTPIDSVSTSTAKRPRTDEPIDSPKKKRLDTGTNKDLSIPSPERNSLAIPQTPPPSKSQAVPSPASSQSGTNQLSDLDSDFGSDCDLSVSVSPSDRSRKSSGKETHFFITNHDEYLKEDDVSGIHRVVEQSVSRTQTASEKGTKSPSPTTGALSNMDRESLAGALEQIMAIKNAHMNLEKLLTNADESARSDRERYQNQLERNQELNRTNNILQNKCRVLDQSVKSLNESLEHQNEHHKRVCELLKSAVDNTSNGKLEEAWNRRLDDHTERLQRIFTRVTKLIHRSARLDTTAVVPSARDYLIHGTLD